MHLIEKFLESKYYIGLVVLLAFIAFIARDQYQIYNTYLTMFFLVLFSILLATFKNTAYTLPLAFALLYTYNLKHPSLATISGFNIIYMIVIFVLGGLLIHFIRLWFTFKKVIRVMDTLWIFFITGWRDGLSNRAWILQSQFGIGFKRTCIFRYEKFLV